MMWAIAHSIRSSIKTVGEVAQALAAGDMDNRCDTHGSDEVSGLSRMINLLADTMQGMLTRLRSEAGRSTFSNQLVEALEMADSEAEADRVIARAMGAISEVHPMELLLADSSRAHLERACVHPEERFAELRVESPYSCIAVRRGHPQIFPDAEALNACPKLLGRMGGSISAACVPVNFMGRALGVLHVTGAKGKPPNPEQIAQLTALGVHAGTRIGTLRAFERSQLQASTDSLTGLINRRAAEEVLSNLMAVDSAFAVVMADLDFFKRLNDTQGHEAGDRALKLFADTAVERRARSRSRGALGRRGVRDVAARRQCRARRGSRGPIACRARAGAPAVRHTGVHGELRHLRFDHDARARDADPARRRGAVPLEAGGTRLLHGRRCAAHWACRACGANAIRVPSSTSRRWREVPS